MKKLALNLIIFLVVLQTAALCAQTGSEPKFSLTISLFQPFGDHAAFRSLRVVETNTSNESFHEDGCYETRGVFNISIVHNGAPLQERDAVVRKKREQDAKLKACRVKSQYLKPGESWMRYLGFGGDYPMTEPGMYQITVSRESDLDHPENSLTVKSNTLTVVVSESGVITTVAPKPEADSPK
jgi:hypothetical protein